MPFLFVDSIDKVTDSSIEGRLTIPANSRYVDRNGLVLPGIVSEAIGQLASWKAIHDNGYSGRPVFLFADRITSSRPVPAGSVIHLHADILKMDDETINFSGHASLDCAKVQEVSNCNGYFMELGKLEDPHVTKWRYQKLTSPDGLGLIRESDRRLEDDISDFVVEQSTDTSISAQMSVSRSCSFYKDHFPRFPVTPIVVINEIIGRVTSKMLCPEPTMHCGFKEVSRIKIKEFIKPGEDFEVHAKLKEKMRVGPNTEEAQVQTQIIKGGKPILRGNYLYTISSES